MKPWKSLNGLSKWLIRIAVAIWIYTRFFDTLMNFNVSEPNFYFAIGFTITGILLIAGGFRQTLTVVAGLILLLLAVLLLVINYGGITSGFAQLLLIASVGAFFLANGNK
jgi:hypothetical protein